MFREELKKCGKSSKNSDFHWTYGLIYGILFDLKGGGYDEQAKNRIS